LTRVANYYNNYFPKLNVSNLNKAILSYLHSEWVNKLNQVQIFIIRAVIGAVIAVVLTRMFTGKIYIPYIVGLAIIMVGLAYFSEYLRQRKSR
jgi:uncharacterized membrane protein HdeD (DUF308 family)